MDFSLDDALPSLRCPVSGAPLTRDAGGLTTADGLRYPLVDGIPDLTVPAQRADRGGSDYDRIAGLAYNLFLFNPFTMAFTWGPGVLRAPWLMRPERVLRRGLFLDVPCGTGIFTARAYRARSEARILAVDYSLGMLRAARARAARLGVRNAVFIRADVARLPIADAVLDGCLSMAGFHAFPEPASAAREIGRVLKPGAALTLSVACTGERALSDMMIARVMKPRGYFRQGLAASTYCDFLVAGGFRDVHADMAGAVAVMRGVRA